MYFDFANLLVFILLAVVFVVATLGATLLHVAASVVAHRRPPQLRYVVLVGMAARLLLIFGGAEPILEGDRTRLRFEGRLVNRGVNPYEFRPVYLGDNHHLSHRLVRGGFSSSEAVVVLWGLGLILAWLGSLATSARASYRYLILGASFLFMIAVTRKIIDMERMSK